MIDCKYHILIKWNINHYSIHILRVYTELYAHYRPSKSYIHYYRFIRLSGCRTNNLFRIGRNLSNYLKVNCSLLKLSTNSRCFFMIFVYYLPVNAKIPSCITGFPLIYTLHLYLNHRGIPVTISNKMQPIDQTSTFFSI